MAKSFGQRLFLFRKQKAPKNNKYKSLQKDLLSQNQTKIRKLVIFMLYFLKRLTQSLMAVMLI